MNGDHSQECTPYRPPPSPDLTRLLVAIDTVIKKGQFPFEIAQNDSLALLGCSHKSCRQGAKREAVLIGIFMGQLEILTVNQKAALLIFDNQFIELIVFSGLFNRFFFAGLNLAKLWGTARIRTNSLNIHLDFAFFEGLSQNKKSHSKLFQNPSGL